MKRRILIIDDDADFRQCMEDLFEHAGYAVMTCASAKEASEQIDYPPPDLIILDLMIPGEDGFESCSNFRKDPRTAATPVFFLTGRSNLDSKLAGFCCGARRYLTKPCDVDELLEAVADELNPAGKVNAAV